MDLKFLELTDEEGQLIADVAQEDLEKAEKEFLRGLPGKWTVKVEISLVRTKAGKTYIDTENDSKRAKTKRKVRRPLIVSDRNQLSIQFDRPQLEGIKGGRA